jgi:DNA-binding CsgD family transcriptional regulator
MNLSGRELQIAGMISQGYFEKEIAERLCLSFDTIHTYTRRIRQKLCAGNIAQITRKYILKYDQSVKTRITNAFRTGRRYGLAQGWAGKAADHAERSLQAVWAPQNWHATPARRNQSGKAGQNNILLPLGTGNSNQNQYDMKIQHNDELMAKIDRLMWLNLNCSKSELDRLIEISKQLKTLETNQNENTQSGN